MDRIEKFPNDLSLQSSTISLRPIEAVAFFIVGDILNQGENQAWAFIYIRLIKKNEYWLLSGVKCSLHCSDASERVNY